MHKTVRQLLATKGNDIWTVTPHTSVYEALQLMAEKNIGAVLVLDDGELCGIFSERDYARKVTLVGKTARETLVSEIMTTNVMIVSPNQSIDECMALMTEKRHRHFPVVEGDQLVGVISIGDVVKAVISDQAFMLGQLETYISGHSVHI